MTLKIVGVAGFGLIAAFAAVQSASAQATATAPKPAAAAAGPAFTPGAALPGICIYSNERAIGGSVVGKFVGQRIETITSQVNAELNAEKNAIQTEGKALEAQRATLPQEQLEQKALQLNQRGKALQAKAQQRSREIDATEQKAVSRIGAEIQPLVMEVVNSRSCGVLLDGNAVLLANPAMDITGAVVTKLNAKITQFAFDRERLDQQAVPGQ